MTTEEIALVLNFRIKKVYPEAKKVFVFSGLSYNDEGYDGETSMVILDKDLNELDSSKIFYRDVLGFSEYSGTYEEDYGNFSFIVQ